jgi:hypothetical protein
MIETLQKVLEGAVERLRLQVTTYLPPLLVALTLTLVAWVVAVLMRRLLYRIFKGLTIDKFLRQSGVAFMIDRSGRLRATRLVAETVYWAILLSGLLMGLSVFDTSFTTQLIQGFIFLLPKLVSGGLILLVGAWLSQYLSRSLLVWAVNEDLPSPRRLATAARVLIIFVAVVVAADQLNFAREVFLAAFVILVGGAVLTFSLAVGVGAGAGMRRFVTSKRQQASEAGDRSLWDHL